MSVNKPAARFEIVSQCITLGDFTKARRTSKSAAHDRLNTAFRKFVRRKNKRPSAEPLSDADAWVVYRARLLRLAAAKSEDEGGDDVEPVRAPVGCSYPPISAISSMDADLCRLLDRAIPGLYLACQGELPESLRHPITPFQRQVADSFASFMGLSEHAIRLQCTQRQTKGLLAWTRELKRRPLSSFTDSDLVSMRCQLSYRRWSYDVGDVASAGATDGLVVVVRMWDDYDVAQRIYWAVRLKDARWIPRVFLDEDLSDADKRVVKSHKDLVRQITADRQCTERLLRVEELTQVIVDVGGYTSADNEDDTGT